MPLQTYFRQSGSYLILLLLFCRPLFADWSTFRHDNQRSASSKANIKLPLHATWTQKVFNGTLPILDSLSNSK